MRPAFCPIQSVEGRDALPCFSNSSRTRSARVKRSTYSFTAAYRPVQKSRVGQTPHRSQAFSSVSRQATGARFPSVSRRILPRVYSSGAFVRRYPPRAPRRCRRNPAFPADPRSAQILHGNALPGGHILQGDELLPAVDRHIDHQAQGVPPLGRNLHETASFSVPSILPQALPECKRPLGFSPPRRHRKLTTVRFSRTIKTTFERYGEEYRSWITQRNPCACIPSGGASWR